MMLELSMLLTRSYTPCFGLLDTRDISATVVEALDNIGSLLLVSCGHSSPSSSRPSVHRPRSILRATLDSVDQELRDVQLNPVQMPCLSLDPVVAA
jgi:hypothetical protein